MKFWIARDQGIRNIEGALFLYINKPISNGGVWYGGEVFYTIDNRLFPEVTFENSPMEVELAIKSQNKVTECYNCHEVIKFTENDVIDGWYVKCPCCGEEISILL